MTQTALTQFGAPGHAVILYILYIIYILYYTIAYPTTSRGIWRFIPHRGDYLPRSEDI